jgi:hypothetical protein
VGFWRLSGADIMTTAESVILSFFRSYHAGPGQIVFFQPGACRLPTRAFRAGMELLIEKQWVVRERLSHAYSLTYRGHQEVVADSVSATNIK